MLINKHIRMKNIEVIKQICSILDELCPCKIKGITSYKKLITFVDDIIGHDVRYAIDASKIKTELNWMPHETFETGIRKTIQWYLDNRTWSDHVKDGSYQSQKLDDIKL